MQGVTVHKVSVEELQQASLKTLEGHIEKLECDLASLDYFFSTFLNYMGHDDMGADTDTPEWILYKKMRKLYEEQDDRLRSARYYYDLG